MTLSDPPRLLGGRYELGTALGQGGMAEVLRGTDVRLGRDVAVKILRADLARDPSFLARFRREAQAAASLNAPTIVSVYDTGEDENGVPYIVMERVEGRTLRDVLQKERRLLPQRALEITAEICSALDTAHIAGIVHRDIKPANVMLTRSGEVKVMDFGIARAAADSSSAMTQTAAVIGTAAYLSPEQARGSKVDARSDLYSTGCLLYELLTGNPPFVGDSPVAVAYQHVREDPAPPSSFDDTLPDSLDAVVLKAMAKNPANRYQSAQDMRADLLRARSGDSVLATPVLAAPPYTASSYAGSSAATSAYTPIAEPPVLAAAAWSSSLRTADDRPDNRGVAYGIFGALLVALLIAVALLVRSLFGGDAGLIPAPALVGLDQAEAVRKLAEQGLRLGKIDQAFADKPFGTVVQQSPDEDILMPTDGAVDLVVSKGLEMTLVPVEVVGQSRDEAVVLLTERKLKVGSEVMRDGNIPPGTVLAISPPPGSQVLAGSEVVLTVASGQVQVPDVRGRTREQAIADLQKAGFSVGIDARDSNGPPDIVLEQTPVNALAPRGSAVVLVVSQLPPPPPPSPSPIPSPTPSPSPLPTPSTTTPPSPPPSSFFFPPFSPTPTPTF